MSSSSLSDLSSYDRSDDEEIDLPRRNFRFRMNPMDYYNEHEFKDRYRLSKAVVIHLVQLLNDLEPITQRNHAISAMEQVLLTINFYSSGAFQITVADCIQVHKSTACKIIKKVSTAIAKLRPHFIKMPSAGEQRAQAKSGFYSIAGFPNVVAALDCTHIKIQSPGGQQAELFRNRKGFMSLNVQCACDSKLKINDIIARWPGSVHDTTIFNDCPLRADFESGAYDNDVLLGDSGYPCRKYLLTPFLNPTTRSEEAYNKAQIATRNPIERCFGVLKRRFPCLSMGLRTKLDTSMKIIVACAILHNIAIDNNDFMDYDDIIYEDASLPEIHNSETRERNENTSVRSSLLRTHFNV